MGWCVGGSGYSWTRYLACTPITPPPKGPFPRPGCCSRRQTVWFVLSVRATRERRNRKKRNIDCVCVCVCVRVSVRPRFFLPLPPLLLLRRRRFNPPPTKATSLTFPSRQPSRPPAHPRLYPRPSPLPFPSPSPEPCPALPCHLSRATPSRSQCGTLDLFHACVYPVRLPNPLLTHADRRPLQTLPQPLTRRPFFSRHSLAHTRYLCPLTGTLLSLQHMFRQHVSFAPDSLRASSATLWIAPQLPLRYRESIRATVTGPKSSPTRTILHPPYVAGKTNLLHRALTAKSTVERI